MTREVENRKHYVHTTNEILRLEKFRVNETPPPPFSSKPKLHCLFVLTVVQLTLHIGYIKCRNYE